MECEIGSKAFIIESNRIIREVTIVRKNSDFMWFGSTAMGASNYGKVGYSHQRRLQRVSFKE